MKAAKPGKGPDGKKVQALISKAEALIDQLGKKQHGVCGPFARQFHYMQKIEELRLLLSQYYCARRRFCQVSGRLRAVYEEVAADYERDADSH